VPAGPACAWPSIYPSPFQPASIGAIPTTRYYALLPAATALLLPNYQLSTTTPTPRCTHYIYISASPSQQTSHCLLKGGRTTPHPPTHTYKTTRPFCILSPVPRVSYFVLVVHLPLLFSSSSSSSLHLHLHPHLHLHLHLDLLAFLVQHPSNFHPSARILTPPPPILVCVFYLCFFSGIVSFTPAPPIFSVPSLPPPFRFRRRAPLVRNEYTNHTHRGTFANRSYPYASSIQGTPPPPPPDSAYSPHHPGTLD